MKHRIVELDALRGIAAVFVVFFHFSIMAGSSSIFLRAGVTGVDLFFLISGYVIFMTLIKIKSGYEFIISRLLRLYPSYLVMMLITLGIIFIFRRTEMPDIKVILGNVTMMQPLFFVPNIDDSYWTLTVEMQFYILMLILYLCGWLKQIERTGSIILTLIILYYLMASFFFENSVVYITPRSLFPVISHFQLFFAGILFYNISMQGATWRRHSLLLACLLWTMFLFDKSGRAHFFIGLTTYGIMIGLYFFIFYLFALKKLGFLNFKLLLFLGNISYGLYLIHQEAGKILYGYILDSHLLQPALARVLLFFLMIAIATAVTYSVEKPVRKLKKYLIKSAAVTVTPKYVDERI
ncbi:MAG TPA: acyltransferase [Chitinophagaceae bacterium]|nr:acyltransferase [Chitinophagaceae bacterium]